VRGSGPAGVAAQTGGGGRPHRVQQASRIHHRQEGVGQRQLLGVIDMALVAIAAVTGEGKFAEVVRAPATPVGDERESQILPRCFGFRRQGKATLE